MLNRAAAPNIRLADAQARSLAVRAHVDPRTIQRALRAAHGQCSPPRGDAGVRAREVLISVGLIEGSSSVAS